MKRWKNSPGKEMRNSFLIPQKNWSVKKTFEFALGKKRASERLMKKDHPQNPVIIPRAVS
jgi:hypothetical protein